MARVRIEDNAGGVQGTAQAVGSGPPPESRPEEIHQLFAMEAAARSEGEQFHQGGGFLKAPPMVLDGPRTYGDPETTEQPESHFLRLLDYGRRGALAPPIAG
jgi:hypothetical protein